MTPMNGIPASFFSFTTPTEELAMTPLRAWKSWGMTLIVGAISRPFSIARGGFGTEEIQLDGNTWAWRGSNVMGVKEHRCIAVVSNDGKTVRARHEKSDDGKNWALWMDVTLRKEG